MTLDLFARSSALLRIPSWLGPDVREEMELAFEPGDYKITPGAIGGSIERVRQTDRQRFAKHGEPDAGVHQSDEPSGRAHAP